LFVFNDNQKVIYGDFLKVDIGKTFKTIIGNPPYIKMENDKNLYLQFIEKCFKILVPDGELIFIVPSDFCKLTSNSKLMIEMDKLGTFTDFYFPQNEKLFNKACVDITVFRYQKTKMVSKCNYNDVIKYYHICNGILTFSDSPLQGNSLEQYFDIYVGLVSGKDEVFSHKDGNIKVLIGEEKYKTFIYFEHFSSSDTILNQHLINHKQELLNRKIRKFTEKNWFEWGAPRNIKIMTERKGQECIYVKNMTRDFRVAFIGKVGYFGGTLLCMIPKKQINLHTIVNFLNEKENQQNYRYSGRFKIGQKQLCNVLF
jgi:adenine-specific DNA-methyltransferase